MLVDALDHRAGARSHGLGHPLELRLRPHQLRQRLLEIRGHPVERLRELPDLVAGGHFRPLREVAPGDDLSRLRQPHHRPHDDARGQQRQQRRDEEGHERHEDPGEDQLVPRRPRLRLVDQHPKIALDLVPLAEGADEEMFATGGPIDGCLPGRDLVDARGRRATGRKRFALGGDEVDVVDRRIPHLQVADDLLQIVGEAEEDVVAGRRVDGIGDGMALSDGLVDQGAADLELLPNQDQRRHDERDEDEGAHELRAQTEASEGLRRNIGHWMSEV